MINKINQFSNPNNQNNPNNPDNPDDLDSTEIVSLINCNSYIATEDTQENSVLSLDLYINEDDSPTTQISWSNDYSKDNPRIVMGHSGTEYKIYRGTESVEDPNSGFITSTKSIPATELYSVDCTDDECGIGTDLNADNENELFGGAEHLAFIVKITSVDQGRESTYYMYAHRMYSSISDFSNNQIDQDVFFSLEEIKFDDFCFPIGYLDEIEHKTN